MDLIKTKYPSKSNIYNSYFIREMWFDKGPFRIIGNIRWIEQNEFRPSKNSRKSKKTVETENTIKKLTRMVIDMSSLVCMILFENRGYRAWLQFRLGHYLSYRIQVRSLGKIQHSLYWTMRQWITIGLG